jgi:hypothetical protein
MKLLKANLLTQVVGSYDQTKTTIQGRVAQKNIGGLDVLGAPLTKFMDFGTDTGGAVPTAGLFSSVNGRIVICGAPTAGQIPVFLYDFNYTTGASTYVGRINVTTPNTAATTHTIRDLRLVNDATNTGWKIYIATVGSVLINGGTFVVNNIDKADFVQVSFPTIPFATGNGQKAVYFSQNSAAIGVAQAETAAVGTIFDATGTKIYTHNGIAATHQYYVRDTAAAMTYASASVTVTVAAPGKVGYTTHPYVANDPVVFTAGTLPTGLVVGTVYFVRNPGANDFELSATSGGASITTTGSAAVGAVIGRAFGTTSSDFLFKTGNLPALAGTLLLTGSERKAIPVAAPISGPTLNGNGCAYLTTTTNLYLGLLSELTANTTTWPSLTTSNILGATNQIVTPTPTVATWSNDLDNAIYVTNTTKFVMKQVANNVITADFGELNNNYLETTSPSTVSFGLTAVNNISSESGWLFICGSTVGQRVIIAMDMKSDSTQNFSYIVTKVLSTPNDQMYVLSSLEKLYDQTGNIKVQYRSSGFGSISGGWIDIDLGADLSAVTTGSQTQFKILFNIQSEGSSSPAQINELLLGYIDNVEISDNWEYSHDQSSTGVPTRCAFRLKKTYQTSVPTLRFKSYDLSDSLLINQTTVSNPTNFEYSTNNGVSWLPLGTIPNVIGTMIRYTFTSPPGVDIRPVIIE